MTTKLKPEDGWFGSAFTMDGMLHADIRLVGPGSVQMMFTPVATEGGTGIWISRLRAGTDATGTDKLTQLADCLADSREFTWAQGDDSGLIYRPRDPDGDSGSIARIRVTPEGEPVWLREMILPLYLFEEMGRHLRKQAAVASRSTAVDDWQPEPATPCAGCDRPIFESMTTALALGVGGVPLLAMCPACACGETLKHIRSIPDGQFPRQRAVLEEFERSMTG